MSVSMHGFGDSDDEPESNTKRVEGSLEAWTSHLITVIQLHQKTYLEWQNNFQVTVGGSSQPAKDYPALFRHFKSTLAVEQNMHLYNELLPTLLDKPEVEENAAQKPLLVSLRNCLLSVLETCLTALVNCRGISFVDLLAFSK